MGASYGCGEFGWAVDRHLLSGMRPFLPALILCFEGWPDRREVLNQLRTPLPLGKDGGPNMVLNQLAHLPAETVSLCRCRAYRKAIGFLPV